VVDLADNKGIDIDINKHIHERARLLILTYIAANENSEVSFNELKSALNLSGGNLSVQLRNLEEIGYVKLDKKIEKRKTITQVTLTQKGYEEFISYLDNMERIIRDVKNKKQ
jgi:DNA-binding HxlR family transcriptional regulator